MRFQPPVDPSKGRVISVSSLKELKAALREATAEMAAAAAALREEDVKKVFLLYRRFDPAQLLHRLTRRVEEARRRAAEEEWRAARTIVSLFRSSRGRAPGCEVVAAGGDTKEGRERDDANDRGASNISASSSGDEVATNNENQEAQGQESTGGGSGGDSDEEDPPDDNMPGTRDRREQEEEEEEEEEGEEGDDDDGSRATKEGGEKEKLAACTKLQALQRGRSSRAKAVATAQGTETTTMPAQCSLRPMQQIADDEEIVEGLLFRLDDLEARKGSASITREEAAKLEAEARGLLVSSSQQIGLAAEEGSLEVRTILSTAGLNFLNEAQGKDSLASQLRAEADAYDKSFNRDIIVLRSDCIRQHLAIERSV